MGDYKSYLYVWCAKNKRLPPDVTFRDGGSKKFICEITMHDFDYVSVGTSTNKKDAQLNAARDYVQFLVRSSVISESEIRTNLRNEGREILGESSGKQSHQTSGSLGLDRPSVFKAGVGPQSLGFAYQPVNGRPPVNFAAINKKTVDEQETLDVNAAIHGNWTVNEAKNRLNQFMQINKIKGEYKFSFVGPDNAKTFIAELTIFVPQLDRELTGRESGSSKMAASKSCALSLIRQLFHLGVVEKCSSVTGTVAKRAEQMTPYPVNLDPQLLDNISSLLDSNGIQWDKEIIEQSSEDDCIVLLAGRQAEHPEEDKKKGRVVTWSPPQVNWDPWRGANIDDLNPNLASATLEYISEALKEGQSVTSADKDRIDRERKQLPIFHSKNKIMKLIASHPVVIIKGATGCGKTTQVCQYILDSYIEEGRGAECNIIVTQPRRISAISVAERVSRERSEEMGTSVGYSVRFETVLPRPYGSVLFCTVGVLLRKLEMGLRGVSHVIVDEIHERDVNTDFLLVVLRDTLHVYPDLRVILMSATVDTRAFSSYFNNCPVVEIPGRCFQVKTIFLEDAIEMLKFVSPPPLKRKGRAEVVEESDEEAELPDHYQQSTKDSLALLDDKDIPFELIHEILMWCRKRGDGAVLIFLPGWSTIFCLLKRLLASHEFRKPGYIILPLHSQLPRDEQKLVFEEPPKGVMKIILATNIAESSITINDVVYVVDCCKVKVKMYTSHNNMIHYATVWASRSNMEQRAGRAGRTANGFCFRLCTKSRYAKLEEHIVAEMLRTPLEELALNIKLLNLGSVAHFLSKALEPPPLDTVIEAQVILKELHCLDEKYDLTPLGRLIAKLPLEPRLARMLIVGCIMELGDAACTIASNVSLSSEVFDIDIAMSGRQRRFAGTRCSDQLAMLNAFQKFMSLEHKGVEAQQEFTCYNELSFPSLVITGEAKTQIKDILTECAFPEESMLPLKYDFFGHDPNLDILAGLLTIGSYPNVCYHKERRKVLTTESKPALIIKTSVNCSKFETNFPTPFFVYNEKLRTKTVYCKGLGMVTPIHILLFGCNQVEVIKNVVRLDGWIQLEMSSRAAALVLSLRPLLESIITKVSLSPDYIFQMTDRDKEALLLIKQLCDFNSGRYNLPPYIMSKNNRMGIRNMGGGHSIDASVSYKMNQMNYQLQNQSLSYSSGKCPRFGNADIEYYDDSYSMTSEDSYAANHSDLKVVERKTASKETDVEMTLAGTEKAVKLDRNTSRALLNKMQQDSAGQKIIVVSSPRNNPQQNSAEEQDADSQFDDYEEEQQAVPPYRGGYRGGYRGATDPYHSYHGQPYNNYQGYLPQSPYGIHQNRGSNRVQSMFGSANYYKQRYTQKPNMGGHEQQNHSYSSYDPPPYIRGRGRRGAYQGRGYGYPEH